MDKYICKVCATIYDPDKGDPEDDVLPGTPFEKVPESWTCPVCGSPKSFYELLPPEEYERIINKKF